MTDLNAIAKDASTADELIQGLFPFIASFIPGGPAVAPLVSGVLNAVDGGLKAIAASRPGASPEDIFAEFVKHLTPGQPNSPALS